MTGVQAELLAALGNVSWEAFEATPGDAQRLFHGRGYAHGEYLQPLTIDWLPPVALVTLYAPRDREQLMSLASALMERITGCESVQVQFRYERQGPVEVLEGKPLSNLIVEENGLRFDMELGRVRNTGLFLDMRNGRQWVKANAEGKRVLNLFSYTCGFSVAAVAGGAKSVTNIDMSSPALTAGRRNHRLNDHDLGAVAFERLNIFKSFGRIKRRGPYDMMVCDPPTFQKGSVDIIRDYPKILRRLDEFMQPVADLLLCLNSPAHGIDFLADAMLQEAPDFEPVAVLSPPPVFKDVRGGELKVMHFRRV